MKTSIKFCYIILFTFGVILLLESIITLLNFLGGGLIRITYQGIIIESLTLALAAFLFGILDISAAYFIYKLKPIGQILGLIAGFSGIMPWSMRQPFFIAVALKPFLSIFSENPKIYWNIPAVIILLLFLTIILILLVKRKVFQKVGE